jgi:hypothetical protein
MGLDLAKELDPMAAKHPSSPKPATRKALEEGRGFGPCLNITGGGHVREHGSI